MTESNNTHLSPAPVSPDTKFDWVIYADATFAGLSVLIPLVGIDWLFEQFFRRRMPATIAHRRNKTIPPEVINTLRRSRWPGCLRGCLLLPFVVVFWVLKRLSKTILYVLTIKEAAETTSYYWQQAFLIDYSLRAGYLDEAASALAARQAFDQVVKTGSTASFYQVAYQIVTGVKHVLRTLNKVRGGTENEVIAKTKAEMKANWAAFEEDLIVLAGEFETAYRRILASSGNGSQGAREQGSG